MTAAIIKAVGQGMNTVSLVYKAISIREAEKAKKHSYDQCWVVFDKDDYPDNDFNQAILLAKSNGFRVAYSNQAFEYWFLLHFNRYTGAIHRNLYPDMLSKLIEMPYSKIQGFGALMYRFLLSRQRQALDNADTILAEVSHGNPAQEESSTTVQKLVVELNKYL